MLLKFHVQLTGVFPSTPTGLRGKNSKQAKKIGWYLQGWADPSHEGQQGGVRAGGLDEDQLQVGGGGDRGGLREFSARNGGKFAG